MRTYIASQTEDGNMKTLFKGHSAELVNYSFQIMLVTYLVLLLVEQIWSGLISVYLNLNYLLLIVIILGILDVFSEKGKIKEEKVTRKDYYLVGILGIMGFAIIKYKTVELGRLSWLISLVAGVLIVLLSVLVLTEETNE